MDLRDLYRPGGGAARLTWRLLGVLVDQLPPDSRTKAAQADEIGPAELAALAREVAFAGYGRWSREALMLAEVVDRLEKVAYVTIRSNGGKATPADPYPRPGVVPRGLGRAPDPRAVAYLDEVRRRRGAVPDPAALPPA